ncbi:HAD family hydrolase [Streptosporangium sp. KLBMP 9127]|nr:HAD family phosphatase [Streptosporangium sp. KLBMP 9127]
METGSVPFPLPLPSDQITGLIFDLDGTLIDTRSVNRLALTSILAEHGVNLDGVPRPPEGTAFTDWVRLLTEHGRLPKNVSPERFQEYGEQAVIERAAMAPAIGPTVALARWAHDRRLPSAVATGSTRPVTNAFLRANGLAELFAAIVTREDVARGKPAPDLFLAAARRLRVPPVTCVVLEDTDIGMEAARNAGMTTVDMRPYRELAPRAAR